MQQISPIKKRMLETIENKGISKYQFYQNTGITRGVLDKETGISEDNIAKYIAYYPDINLEWLITGKGTMLKDGNTELKKTITLDNADYLRKHGIPLIPIEAMAGIGSNAEYSISENDIQDYFIIPQLKGLADCAFIVTGDSMAYTYLRGDYVICKKIYLDVDFIQWNKAYVLDTTQGTMVKRVLKCNREEFLTCVSDNTSYDPFDIPISSIRNIALVLALVRLE